VNLDKITVYDTIYVELIFVIYHRLKNCENTKKVTRSHKSKKYRQCNGH